MIVQDYFTITGHVLEGHRPVQPRQVEVEAVFAKLIEMEDAAKAAMARKCEEGHQRQ